MSAHIKVSNSWKDIGSIHVKVSNSWKEVSKGYTKVNGEWKLFYEDWNPVAITLTNPNSALVFYCLTGNLYTDSSCTNLCVTNTIYTGTTFYYKDKESAPTGSYLYDYGSGTQDNTFISVCSACTASFLSSRYSDSSLTTLFGSSDTCWTIDRVYHIVISGIYINLSDGSTSITDYGFSKYRCNAVSF